MAENVDPTEELAHDEWHGVGPDGPEDILDDSGAPVIWGGGADQGHITPHYVDIRYEHAGGSTNVLTNLAMDFLEKLSRRFAARLEAIQQSDQAEEVTAETSDWRVSPRNDGQPFVDLMGDADAEPLIQGLNSTTGVYVASFGTAWETVQDAHSVVRRRLSGTTIYRNEGDPIHEPVSGDADLVVRLRPMAEEDERMLIHRRHLNSALRDFGLHAFFNGKAVEERNETLGFQVRGIYTVEMAEWWRDVMEATEDLLGLSGETLGLTIEFDAPVASAQATAICKTLRGNLAGAILNGPAFVENGGTMEALDDLARTLGSLGGSTGLRTGAILSSSKKEEIAHVRNLGIQGIQVNSADAIAEARESLSSSQS